MSQELTRDQLSVLGEFAARLKGNRIGLLITNVCNRKCEFCFQAHGYPQELHITDEDFEAFCAWSKQHDVRAFSVAGGELTPTMKLRRRFVEERYRDVLDGLYAG